MPLSEKLIAAAAAAASIAIIAATVWLGQLKDDGPVRCHPHAEALPFAKPCR